MAFLAALWLPILVGAVLVFVVSSLVHMVFKWHASDCLALPDEARVLEALRAQRAAPGMYPMPKAASMAEMGTPEMKAKYEQGPVAILTVLPNGVPNIGAALLRWFLLSLAIGALAGYVAWHALGAGAGYLAVFRITGTVAFAAYAMGEISDWIWKGQTGAATAKFLADGLLYALATAGAFGWLWPAA